MRIVFESVDMRGGYPEQVAWETPIIDQDSGRMVGTLYEETKPAKRYISLFGGKYCAEFKTPAECQAFAKGVEAVINNLMPIDEEQLVAEKAP